MRIVSLKNVPDEILRIFRSTKMKKLRTRTMGCTWAVWESQIPKTVFH